MKSNVKIAMVQFNACVGAPHDNGERMINIMQDLAQYDSDIIIFPEMVLSGYPLQDLAWNNLLLKSCHQMIGRICDASRQLKQAVIFGTPYRENTQYQTRHAVTADGGGFDVYNSIFVVDNGQVVAKIGKVHLPIGEVFDETRNFISDAVKPPVMLRHINIGVANCHDIWLPDICQCYHECGAKFIIAANASPFDKDKYQSRINVIQQRIAETKLPLIYVNLVGGQDELVFDGASLLMDKNQQIVTRLSEFKEEIALIEYNISNDKFTFIHDISQQDKMMPIAQKAIAPLYDENEKIYHAMVLGVRDYIQKSGFQKVILGLSGGIDSALTAAIAVDALDDENVTAYALPSQFTSDESLRDAKDCADNLNIALHHVHIAPMLHAAHDSLRDDVALPPSNLAYENLQSRCRGTLLMTISNQTGALLLTTGNKSENAVGYATIYGDMAGAYNPIKNLYKSDVYKISRWLNQYKGKNIIPENIITKAPSAELRPDQCDQDSLPDYKILDGLLKIYIEGRGSPQDAINQGYDDKTAKEIYKLLLNSEYKRAQSAPGVRIGNSDFGLDWRQPIQNKLMQNKLTKDYL